jgi:hypothetical protein
LRFAAVVGRLGYAALLRSPSNIKEDAQLPHNRAVIDGAAESDKKDNPKKINQMQTNGSNKRQNKVSFWPNGPRLSRLTY